MGAVYQSFRHLHIVAATKSQRRIWQKLSIQLQARGLSNSSAPTVKLPSEIRARTWITMLVRRREIQFEDRRWLGMAENY